MVLATGLAVASPSVPGSRYRLTWERQSDQTLPGAPPAGWTREYLTNPPHTDGEPAARIALRTAGEPVRDGDHSVRFDLRVDDPVVPNTGSSGKRAELAARLSEPRRAERWYGFSVYLKDWTQDTKAAEIVTQWHQTGGVCDAGCSPPLSLLTDNGQWIISQNWQKRTSSPEYLFCRTPIGAYQANRWTDWVFHVKWSTGTSGRLEVWRDGRKLQGLGPIGGRTDDYGDRIHGNYIKIGIYKWKWAQQPPASDVTKRVLFHDALRIAGPSGSYAAVAPRPIRSGLPLQAAPRRCT
jgi:hypothetical protein